MLRFSTLSRTCSRSGRVMRARMLIAVSTLATSSLLASCGSSEPEPEPESESPSEKDAGSTGKPKPTSDGGSSRDGGATSSGRDGGTSGNRDAGSQPARDDGGAKDSGASSGETIPASFETVKLVLSGGGGIMPCFAAPCHGEKGAAPPDHPLELPLGSDDKLFANLTTYVSKACNDTKLVTPGKPAQSALVTILKGPCGETPRMPYDCSDEAGDCIPDEYIEAVSKWIADGAKR